MATSPSVVRVNEACPETVPESNPCEEGEGEGEELVTTARAHFCEQSCSWNSMG